MNLEELRSVQRAERQKDSLQHLRDSFYEDVAAYIAQLKDERERAVAAADDPFASEDVRRLTDELESTKEIANALYERRVGKVVKHASFAAADMNTDEEGMTTEERVLFEDLVGRIKRSRESVFATLEGKAEAASVDDSTATTEVSAEPEPDQSVTDPAQPSDDGLLADALGGGSEPDADTPADRPQEQPTDANGRSTEESPSADDGRPLEEASAVLGDNPGDTSSTSASSDETDVADDRNDPGRESDPETERKAEAGTDPTKPDRATVRITSDVGTVYGVDEREYDLAREDVVVLPTTNAEPLVKKNAAERID